MCVLQYLSKTKPCPFPVPTNNVYYKSTYLQVYVDEYVTYVVGLEIFEQIITGEA